MHTFLRIAALAAVTPLVLGGCGTADTTVAGADGYPTTVQNCGRDVRVERRPERVVALGPSEVSAIWAAGGADRLVARDDAGLKSAPYPPDLRAAVSTAPQLGTGGEAARESVIAAQPDLVVGSVTETVTPEALEAVGIPLYSLRGNCGSNHAPGVGDGTADFDDVFDDIDTLGRLLGTSPRASATVADMRRRIARATEPAASRTGRSAAAVIVYDNGIKAYGGPSMAHTQMEALGLRDVFSDVGQRVFEANLEEVISRDPDQLVVLSYADTPAGAKAKFLRIPGAANLKAVRDDAILVQPYEYSSQGPLSVTGLENMSRNLKR